MPLSSSFMCSSVNFLTAGFGKPAGHKAHFARLPGARGSTIAHTVVIHSGWVLSLIHISEPTRPEPI
eukprot:2723215-Pyramimonas_sp.AAC.1